MGGVTLTSKDIGWIVVVSVQVIGFIATIITYKLKVDVLRKIIFDESGRLNVMDAKSCREHRLNMKESLDQNSREHKELGLKINKLYTNSEVMMHHLKIKKANRERGD